MALILPSLTGIECHCTRMKTRPRKHWLPKGWIHMLKKTLYFHARSTGFKQTASNSPLDLKREFVFRGKSTWTELNPLPGIIEILNRSHNSVFLFLNSANLWSHPRLGNLNETRNALSPSFFLKIPNSVFQSINMGVHHKLLLQLFLIDFFLFCCKIEKRWV